MPTIDIQVRDILQSGADIIACGVGCKKEARSLLSIDSMNKEIDSRVQMINYSPNALRFAA